MLSTIDCKLAQATDRFCDAAGQKGIHCAFTHLVVHAPTPLYARSSFLCEYGFRLACP